jgi:hypothetical protein
MNIRCPPHTLGIFALQVSLCTYAREIRGSLYVAKFSHLAKKKGVLATTCTKDFFWEKRV